MTVANIRETLLHEFDTLPPAYYSDVLDFMESLKMKRQPTIPETMILSESALSQDWDTADEDNAWASL